MFSKLGFLDNLMHQNVVSHFHCYGEPPLTHLPHIICESEEYVSLFNTPQPFMKFFFLVGEGGAAILRNISCFLLCLGSC